MSIIKDFIDNLFCPYAFRTKKAYDIKYKKGVLSFTTKDKLGEEHLWEAYGDGMKWAFVDGSGKVFKCDVFTRIELNKIWRITTGKKIK